MKNYKKYIHIVSFDIPFPADYGGVIDVFYKLKALNEAGIGIILHCFEYGRQRSEELEKLCEKVYYYKRKIYKNPFIGNEPYIISTRNNKELLENLLKDDYPILFEGIHTCHYLSNELIADRVKFVRTHNIEHDYYQNLEASESNYIKRKFFKKESERLAKYECTLKHANYILAISEKDKKHYAQINSNCLYLPAFHQNTEFALSPKVELGKFILYHGNLGVGENNLAAKYIVKEIWRDDFYLPLIIAGNNASTDLRNLCKKNKNISLVSPTNSQYIDQLISTAQINLLITFQATGIKLKLINSLYMGKHCIVNQEMIEDTGLEVATHVSKPEEYREKLKLYFSELYTEHMQLERKILLQNLFDNKCNIQVLTSLL